MALLSQHDIHQALTRLGQLAAAEGHHVVLVVVGGAAMVLGYQARLATHDIDAVFVPPPAPALVRQWVAQIAHEYDWPSDWLNDGAKGFLNGLVLGSLVFTCPGIEVYQASTAQLLAMKLSAWRDDTDIMDATILLRRLGTEQACETVWSHIAPFVVYGRELKAHYAFLDLWESIYGSH